MPDRIRIDHTSQIKAGTCTLGSGATQLLSGVTRRPNVIGVLMQPESGAGTVTIGDATAQDIVLPDSGMYLSIADPWQLYVKGTQGKKVYYILFQ